MRFVALGALRDLSVDAVTGGAVQGGMLALIVPELGDLLCMAGKETSVGYKVIEINDNPSIYDGYEDVIDKDIYEKIITALVS